MGLKDVLKSNLGFNSSKCNPEYLTPLPGMAEDINDLRSSQEDKLYRYLKQTGRHILLFGQGGTGKTYMARKLFYRLSHVYDRLAWVEYGTDMRSALVSSFSDFEHEKNLDVRFSKIIRKLAESSKSTILFIDDAKENAINDDVLARITGLGITIFITSRCETIPPYETHRILPASAEECVELFYSHYPYDKKRKHIKTVCNLAALMDYNVFAVLLLARIIGNEQNLESHARKLRAQLRAAQGENNSPAKYIERLLELAKLNHTEKRILQCFSLMPSGETSSQISQWFEFSQEHLDSLVTKGWLSINDVTAGYYLHDLIREYFQSVGLANEIVSQLLLLFINDNFITESDSVEIVTQKIEIVEHALRFAEKQSVIFVVSTLRLGDFYRSKNKHLEALRYYERSLESANQISNLSFDLMVNIYWDLGMTHDSIGRYDEALHCYQRAKDFIEQLNAPDDVTLAGVQNNIANVYYHKCNYTEALARHTKVIRIREQTLGVSDPETANSYNNIASIYCDIGEYEKSLEYHLKALDIREQVYGKIHPIVGDSYNNIGSVYSDSGNVNTALEYYTKALSIYQQSNNDNSLQIARCYNNIGGCFERLGNYEESLKYHKKAIEIKEQVLGYSHPDTASSYSNIGNTYDDIGEHSEALKYKTKALSIIVQARGKQHPDTAYAYNNIGCSYLCADKFDEALDHLYKANIIARKVFGSSHPVIADILDNIGEALCKQKDFTNALEYHYESFDIRSKIPSLNIAKIAESYFCLSKDYFGMADYDKALEYGLKALEIQYEKMPLNHPNIAEIKRHLCNIYAELGQIKQAVDYGVDALIQTEEKFGGTHPKYQEVRNTVLPHFHSCYPDKDFDTWVETKKKQ